MSAANERQVGGNHYKAGNGEEHWDRVHRLGLDYMQAQITKYVERAWLKNGVEDLEKAQHFLQKAIEQAKASGRKGAAQLARESEREQVVQELEDQVAMAIAERDYLLQNVVLTETGTIVANCGEFSSDMTCLKGSAKDFTHEGSYGDGRVRWRCVKCLEWFYAPVGMLPHAYGHACKPAID